jgi:hypothetical protein
VQEKAGKEKHRRRKQDHKGTNGLRKLHAGNSYQRGWNKPEKIGAREGLPTRQVSVVHLPEEGETKAEIEDGDEGLLQAAMQPAAEEPEREKD